MEYDFTELKKYSAWMDTFHKDIVHFHGSPDVDITEDNSLFIGFKPFREGKTELEEKMMYVTIRCGLVGIYTCLNEWMGGRWGAECLDGSTAIAYRELREEEKYNG